MSKSNVQEPLIRVYFAIITVPTGERFVGKLTEAAFSHWTLNKSKLIVDEPKRIDAIPVHEKHGGPIIGFSFSIVPTFPAKTPQEKMVFDACSVEMLEEITTDADGHQRCGEDKSGLFAPYIDMVEQWRNELSDIIMPPNKKIITTGRTPDGTIPFRGKR